MIPDYLLLLFGKCPAVKGNLKPEDGICVEFANRMRKWLFQGRLNAVWCHVPNEFSGKSSHLYGALKTAMGRVKGAADYWFITSSGGFVIEFKVPGRTQSDHQVAFQFWCEAQNIPYYICYSADQGESILSREGVLV